MKGKVFIGGGRRGEGRKGKLLLVQLSVVMWRWKTLIGGESGRAGTLKVLGSSNALKMLLNAIRTKKR
jgi:hypothetical protein